MDRMYRGSALGFLAVSVAVVCFITNPAFARKVTLTSPPTVSSSVLVADDTTQYTVTLTASSVGGYQDITSMRVLFNYTESGGDTSKGRGYMAWGAADANINNYGGTWVFADATGGGRWAYQTSPWDSTPYITPLACAITNSGSATGATGSRTATFMFAAKPAWASNPVLNDADAWISTAASSNESNYCMLGWRDAEQEFAVVAAPCAQTAATPGPPVLSNPTVDTLDIAINPGDSETDLYAIRISPPADEPTNVNMVRAYVQADGTLGLRPVWQTKAAWATRSVTGLTSSTTYTFQVCAFNNNPETCPSAWGAGSTATTALRTHTVDCSAPGIVVNKGVHGMDAQTKVATANTTQFTLDVSHNTSMRFGGDGYMWKTCTAQWNANTDTTLKYMRHARDRNSFLQILTNTRGIGTGNGSTWVYTDQTPETLAAMAADLVYYCNVLVQNKRQGDPLAPEEQALLDSLDWGTNDKLLAPGEAPVDKVIWWEIGNEPEGPYPPPSLTPADYANRYSIMSAAMLAKDPTIKVGPGCMTADNGNAWLDAVFANPANQVDLVAYHPYGNLFGITKNNTGGYLEPTFLMRGLAQHKLQQAAKKQNIVDRLVAFNRPADTPLLLSEWNTSSWQGTYYYGLGQTVIQGLGTAEDIFTFIELGITAAQYWDRPNIPDKTGLEVPCFKVFKALQAYLPDRLTDSLVDGYFRLYTTKDSRYDRIILWAINFAETEDKSVRIQLQSLPPAVTWGSIARRTLAAHSGETSLITGSTTTELVGWTETDLTGQIDPTDFTMTFDNATLTMLIFDLDYIANAPIVLTPTSLSHTAFVGSSLPDDPITIASGGPDALNFTLATNAPWLSALPTSGVADGTGLPIAVKYNTDQLAPGTHTATITVSSDDAYNSPQVVRVTVTIEPSPMDRDVDGDIDMEDFGRFQACLSGWLVPQNDPACAWAKLSGHNYVDRQDMLRFLECMTAPALPPSPSCGD